MKNKQILGGESGILTQVRREGKVYLALPPLSAMIIIIVNREEGNSFSTNLSISSHLGSVNGVKSLIEQAFSLLVTP
jgi:hypothetical protein